MQRTYDALLGVYVASLITANFIAGVKLANLLGFVVPAGFLAYCVTFPVTDIAAELFGFDASKRFVLAGFVANTFSLLLIAAGLAMPPLVPEMQELYVKAFTPTFRVVAASIAAYLVSQYLDVYVFWWLRIRTRGRHLWLRNNVGELTAQLVDTCIFITLAFYGTVPASVLPNMVVSQYIWKVVVALLDTPFVYATLYLIRAIHGVGVRSS
jgi:uncharacterized integral membrane protein (TIGR00697 family)